MNRRLEKEIWDAKIGTKLVYAVRTTYNDIYVFGLQYCDTSWISMVSNKAYF